MPTYEFRCPACGYVRDEYYTSPYLALHDLGDCPRCFTNTAVGPYAKLERQLGAGSAVIFKGSGFYKTDHRSKEYCDAAQRSHEKT